MIVLLLKYWKPPTTENIFNKFKKFISRSKTWICLKLFKK